MSEPNWKPFHPLAEHPVNEWPEWAKKRRPGNVFIGLGLAALIGGVYYYTMVSISRNDFSDVANDRKIASVKKE
jgi:hypothetical protein